MYTTLVSLAIIAAAAVQGVVAKDLKVNVPVLKQCGSAQITWDQSQGPYNIIVVPAEDPCEKVLADLGDHQGTSTTWGKVALVAGQKVLVSLEDGKQDEGWSQEMIVQPSTDTSCLSPAQLAVAKASPAASSTVSAAGFAADSTGIPTIINVGGGNAAATTSSAVIAGPIGAANSGLLPNGASRFSVSGPVVFGGALLAALALL